MMRGHRGWRELNMLNGDKISKINNFIGGLMSPKSSENKAIAGSKESEDEEWNYEQVQASTSKFVFIPFPSISFSLLGHVLHVLYKYHMYSSHGT